ncbi:hypothetical protein [Pseudoroseomonas cervicalis]|uniref:hypothetical protein n=1 Tax=Teichococcus cervicalis TaxID=204525 RepID=UPI0022F1DB0E|nr:hypothetical protein [Pseudoroseomonas cervicalis]WBV44893.1 hypothetical protein PFY06_17445 [Pseudoroseomonas cervicalis]
MTQALNEEAFSQPHWLLLAKGFNLQDWYGRPQHGTAVERNGGIENPNRTRLHTRRTLYYRFADSRYGEDGQQGGGWWLEYEQLEKVMRGCAPRGLNLGQMARHFLAVPWEWSHIDRVISAVFEQPMDAYEGRGRPVELTGRYGGRNSVDAGQGYGGDRNVIQLYIPAMRQHWRQALGQVRVQDIRDFARGHRDLIRV